MGNSHGSLHKSLYCTVNYSIDYRSGTALPLPRLPLSELTKEGFVWEEDPWLNESSAFSLPLRCMSFS
jgi:hypothetical protein